MRSNGCPKCQGTMTEGFIVDVNQGGARTVSTWVEGAPAKAWYGIRLRGKAQREVQTWRCGRCGYLESYARG